MSDLQGRPASPGIVSGPVVIIKKPSECEKATGHEIVVLRTSSPTLVNAAIRALGIVTDIGGVTSHLASIARELGIPCVVATEVATEVLRDGIWVTVDGNNGIVYW